MNCRGCGQLLHKRDEVDGLCSSYTNPDRKTEASTCWAKFDSSEYALRAKQVMGFVLRDLAATLRLHKSPEWAVAIDAWLESGGSSKEREEYDT
jgi:hypothetical protein